MIRRSWGRRDEPEVDCRAVARVLQTYLDGDLDDDFAAKIGAHLDACKHCGLEFETYRQIKSSLARRLPEVDPAAVARLRAFGARIAGETHGR